MSPTCQRLASLRHHYSFGFGFVFDVPFVPHGVRSIASRSSPRWLISFSRGIDFTRISPLPTNEMRIFSPMKTAHDPWPKEN
jgi:hypothetical protein